MRSGSRHRGEVRGLDPVIVRSWLVYAACLYVGCLPGLLAPFPVGLFAPQLALVAPVIPLSGLIVMPENLSTPSSFAILAALLLAMSMLRRSTPVLHGWFVAALLLLGLVGTMRGMPGALAAC